jgi:uncharacterized protein (TIGR02145 family)
MVSIKTVLTGLFGVSLCMADISGIVTDTGTTPLGGAVVRLEKGGQTATTGADGSFTLVVNAVILPGTGRLLPNALSARISGKMLNVTLAERSVVEVATFDLGGKALLAVRQTMGAGSHSIALPQQGAGVYLNKVKSGNREFVLKGNSVDGGSSVSEAFFQGPSSNLSAKQANAGTLMDADENEYQCVQIGNQVWMAENLRTTSYNDGSPISNGIGDTAWGKCSDTRIGAYCFYDNTTDSDRIARFGALYNWYAVNTAKLAPLGWHVPTLADWDTLWSYLIVNGYNYDGTTTSDKIAKSMAANTDWAPSQNEGAVGNDLSTNNKSGFSALPGGYREHDGRFLSKSNLSEWWIAPENSLVPYFRSLNSNNEFLYMLDGNDKWGVAVRLVRD